MDDSKKILPDMTRLMHICPQRDFSSTLKARTGSSPGVWDLLELDSHAERGSWA